MIQTVAVVGTGVIGCSWAAHFLAHGLRVVATDPADGAEDRLVATIDRHWQWMKEQGMVQQPSHRGLHFDADLERAISGAEFVQENGPEDLHVKQPLFARMDAVAERDVVLATSSSGLRISAIQSVCRFPERVIVGHPVNPPHLLPLVEVVGGPAASMDALACAMKFYAAVGKQPIHIKVEVPGHIVNRLQAALWQEMIYLVSTGVASAAQIDAAMRYAIGPRWAAQGPFVNLHLSGGTGGLRRVLEALGPAIESWWRDLGRVTLTPEIVDKVAASANQLLAEEGEENLASRRDTAVARILRLMQSAPGSDRV